MALPVLVVQINCTPLPLRLGQRNQANQSEENELMHGEDESYEDPTGDLPFYR